MSQNKLTKVKRGQKIIVTYENRDFEVIVIDPDGLGKNQPSVGLGFNMIEKHAGLPQQTSTNWLVKGDPNNDSEFLQLPSGNTYRVTQIIGVDKNEYSVVEISDWVALAADVLKKPGKVRKSTNNAWHAVNRCKKVGNETAQNIKQIKGA